MLKFCFFFLFTCVCAFSQAQVNYYNRTNDIENSINANEDLLILNQDTSLLTGFLRDSTGKRFNVYTFIENLTGDTISSFRYGRDTIDIYGGNTNNIYVNNTEIYSCGVYYKSGKAYANFLKFTLSGTLILDSLYFDLSEWTQFDCLLPTNDGNFLIVGSKESIPGDLDGWLVKMDQNGNILWEKTFDYSTYDAAIKIAPHLNNFLISAGKTDLITNEIDFWLICVDLDGNIVWEKTFGGPYYDGGNAISLQNSQIHVSGSREYAQNKKESYVMRLNSTGELIWQKSLFIMGTAYAPSSLGINIELSDGSIMMGGTTYENDSPLDYPVARIFKMNQNGDSLWTRILKQRNNDNYLTDIKDLDNGDFLMVGYVFPDSPDNTEDGWIMRSNCLGYFEHPKDSIVFTGDGSNIHSLTNYSSFYEYTLIDWGDNSSNTLYESGNQNIVHEYSVPGNYIITSKIIACNDTIQKSYEYLVTPEQYGLSDLVIFPNPNQGEFEIWLNAPDAFNIDVFDINGRLIDTRKDILLNSGFALDLSVFESSVYFVRATSGDQFYQQRVVITK